jgi:hypothetical protein
MAFFLIFILFQSLKVKLSLNLNDGNTYWGKYTGEKKKLEKKTPNDV